MKEISETIEVRVRFSEVDPIRVVWHGSYVKYMEDAREAFGRRYGLSYMEIFNFGYYAPVYDMHLRFERSAGVDDVLLVKITWRPATGAKLCFDYSISRKSDGALLLEASTIQLFTTSEGVFEPSAPQFFKDWQERMKSLE